MQTQVSKSQFKSKALEYFRHVEADNQSMIITDHGKPTIEIRKYQKNQISPLELLKNSVTEYKNPTDPIATDEWQVLK